VCTIQFQEVKVLPQESYEVVCLNAFVSINSLANKEHAKIILYTFRDISSLDFEPFLCISETSSGQELFAYSNDDEFILEEIEGAGYETMFQKLKDKATERKMLSLARFLDLLERALK